MKPVAKRLKSKHRHVKKYCASNIKKFFSETSLHGLQYVVDDTITIWERLFFLCAFIIAVAVALHLAMEIFFKWQSTPVIIGKSATAINVNSIPFPSVTLCNMNQAQHGLVDKFQEGSLDYAYLKKACFEPFNYTAYKNMKPRNSEDTLANFIAKNSQSCSDMIVSCKYGYEDIKCTHLFREVLMDEGLCCVFNALHPFFAYKGDDNIKDEFLTATYSERIPIHWDPEKGYENELPRAYYPMKAIGAGISLGFSVVLNADIEDYYCSSTNGPGFKVALNNPIDTPHIRETGLPIMIGYQSIFRIEGRISKAEETVRSIKPQERECYFNNEIELLYYKYYTRRNCEMECNSRYMLRKCRCIPHHLPLIYSNASICNIPDFDCVNLADLILKDEKREHCKQLCLPSCFDTTYTPKVFTAPFFENISLMRHRYFRNLTKEYIHENVAVVQFYYKDSFLNSNVRTTYTDFTDFLSQTGGIMSFLMGFSVVSIAEISYYTIWRAIFEIFLKRKTEKRVHLVNAKELEDIGVAKATEEIMPANYVLINKENLKRQKLSIYRQRGITKKPTQMRHPPTYNATMNIN